MKRLLIDLNVLLDVILARPGQDVAAQVWAAIEKRRGVGVIPAHGLTTIYYVVRRSRGRAFARRAVEGLMQVFSVAPVDQNVLRRALALEWSDFEDAVCTAAAEAAECDAIVTRDAAGFADSPVEIVSPETAAAWLGEG